MQFSGQIQEWWGIHGNIYGGQVSWGYYLIFDEIDQLLNSPLSCESFSATLRFIKTSNDSALNKPYAIDGILGIGVLHISKISITVGQNLSPFNVAQLMRLQQTVLSDVVEMFSDYGKTIDLDLTSYAEDIFGRAGGHLGLVCLLGKY